MFKINEIRWPCNVITMTGRLSAFDATASHPPPAALANASWVSSSPEGRVKPSYAPGFRSATHWAWEQLVHQYVLCHLSAARWPPETGAKVRILLGAPEYPVPGLSCGDAGCAAWSAARLQTS